MKNYSKYANWYDKYGNIINKKDQYGKTRDYTIEEVAELLNNIPQDKDEEGKVKNPEALNNAYAILAQMYKKYGNPYKKYGKSTEEQKVEALNEVAKELDSTKQIDSVETESDDDQYIEFEEVD